MEEEPCGSENGSVFPRDLGKKNRRHRSARLRQKAAQQQAVQDTAMATPGDASGQQPHPSEGAQANVSVYGDRSTSSSVDGSGSNSDGATSSSFGMRRSSSSKGGVLFNLDESSTSNEENTEAEEEIGPLGGRQPSLSSQASLDAASAAAAAIMTDPALHTPKMR
ncbi:hypothetical protein PoB_002020700 [Plakobranchus ocellatus]|uniref:Uncharacterized protein n=1 Tax=Plakobranchus ocellatus TaxID=259542 RepID=A0AAV3ZGU0_9GAST|nr:hypothetical protein PoB_002020700 [Plakobranchus ocellatus]